MPQRTFSPSVSARHRRLRNGVMYCVIIVIAWLGMRYTFDYINSLIDQKPDVAKYYTQQSLPSTASPHVQEPEPVPAIVDTQKLPESSKPAMPAIHLPPKPVVHESRLSEYRLLLHTIGGDIVLALYPDAAPKTVQQFIEWARLGVFDTTHFSRLEPGFVLQTSLAQDRQVPFSEIQKKAIHTLPGEFSKTLKHHRGVISMGRADGQPDSGETSFSILLGDAPHLDGSYTIFGCVEAGMDVVDRLVQVKREPDSNRPEVRLSILSVEVVHQDDLATLALQKPRELAQIDQQLFPPSALAFRSITILKQHCWKCHGGESVKGELDLTSQKSFMTGGEHGPLVQKNNLDASLLMKRILSHDDDRMPPKGNGLHSEEIKTIGQWLGAGAVYPPPYALRQSPVSNSANMASAQTHWAWQPWKPIVPPTVSNQKWCHNDIDRFILAKLDIKQLKPVSRAADDILKRRLSYGLTGLPPVTAIPEPNEWAAVKFDFGKSVDQLPNSPRFGEHQARQWLDLVRYADSDGYEDDKNRPLAYAYRDFVIRAFNNDLPFDQFLRWQIAGDEDPTGSAQARAATDFLAAGPYQTFSPRKKDRYDELDDIVTTTGVAFLGMTVGCARCHDHKYDPISQHDYYRLVSVFHSSNRQEDYLDAQAGQRYQQLRAPVDLLKKELEALSAPAREKARNEKIDSLPIKAEEKAALKLPFDANNAVQANFCIALNIFFKW